MATEPSIAAVAESGPLPEPWRKASSDTAPRGGERGAGVAGALAGDEGAEGTCTMATEPSIAAV
eukprot:CAMPEP_0119373872 /NCGR_PEP_ID=MMETSP1334-20130426/27893_1 /TAXON_ID=127549 /ORGANISM="Calcidiscus leptoporus, Strain RCC1130" /LENGTH=63 /DNA_ID=CAMNT_0007391767 /DNA_START=13 /DNA_END=200 /DNA_ORIENTATION=-